MRVLIVEDDPDIADALAEALVEDGVEAAVALCAASARAKLDAETFDVALVDWILRPHTAENLLRAIATLRAPPGVVLMSGSPDARDVAKSLGLPFVRKPFDVDALLKILRAASRPVRAAT